MLRKIRTILATICILLITLLFVDFTGMLHTWLAGCQIQFLPAVLALNAGVILFLVVLTLVSGRYLLLGHMPFRYISGHRGTNRQKKEKKCLTPIPNLKAGYGIPC